MEGGLLTQLASRLVPQPMPPQFKMDLHCAYHQAKCNHEPFTGSLYTCSATILGQADCLHDGYEVDIVGSQTSTPSSLISDWVSFELTPTAPSAMAPQSPPLVARPFDGAVSHEEVRREDDEILRQLLSFDPDPCGDHHYPKGVDSYDDGQQGHMVPSVLLDNGSALNVYPLATTIALGRKAFLGDLGSLGWFLMQRYSSGQMVHSLALEIQLRVNSLTGDVQRLLQLDFTLILSLIQLAMVHASHEHLPFKRLARGKLVHFHGWKSLALPSVGLAKTTELCILALGTFLGNLSSKELEAVERKGLYLLTQTVTEGTPPREHAPERSILGFRQQKSNGKYLPMSVASFGRLQEPFRRRKVVFAKFRRHPRGLRNYFATPSYLHRAAKLASTLRFPDPFSRHESAPKVAATTVIKNKLHGRFSLLFLLAIRIHSWQLNSKLCPRFLIALLILDLLWAEALPSSLHQKVKFIHDRQVLQISHSEDDLFFTRFTFDEVQTLEVGDFYRDLVGMSFDQHSSTVVLNMMRGMSFMPGLEANYRYMAHLHQERVRAYLTCTPFDYPIRPYRMSLENYFVRGSKAHPHMGDFDVVTDIKGVDELQHQFHHLQLGDETSGAPVLVMIVHSLPNRASFLSLCFPRRLLIVK
ncbi:hypothetical protein CK203_051418 [Vitis vinifera]|uniref:Uncharacterized protein n=1 Tax=Vitis vinifera TaxID=29760 RepID=A0A438H1A5_VITVI|nr:hypothetical protein CK203_051418 [Vitis vinifera]